MKKLRQKKKKRWSHLPKFTQLESGQARSCTEARCTAPHSLAVLLSFCFLSTLCYITEAATFRIRLVSSAKPQGATKRRFGGGRASGSGTGEEMPQFRGWMIQPLSRRTLHLGHPAKVGGDPPSQGAGWTKLPTPEDSHEMPPLLLTSSSAHRS